MHHRIALGDVDVELVERVAPWVLEILIDLDRDILPREVMDELIAVGAKLVGNRRKKDADRHGSPAQSSSAATLPHSQQGEHYPSPLPERSVGPARGTMGDDAHASSRGGQRPTWRSSTKRSAP